MIKLSKLLGDFGKAKDAIDEQKESNKYNGDKIGIVVKSFLFPGPGYDVGEVILYKPNNDNTAIVRNITLPGREHFKEFPLRNIEEVTL
tara:strand:- start:2560 stop:2826 length:267 start_codon:yes stop_codon:yes gene_type:complete